MQKQVNNLQKLMDENWAGATTEGGKEALIQKLIDNHPKVIEMRKLGKTNQEIDQFVQQKKKREYWEIGNGYQEIEQSLQDSLIKDINRLHAAVLVVSSNSGRIMGYLGGIDYGFSQRDNLLDPKQVGSTFKPITYLAALETGEDPCNYYDNNLITYSKYDNWQPKNANNSYGGSYSMHGALAHSVNTVSVSLQFKVGIDRVIKQASKMGIEAKLPKVPSIVLGTADISLLEMVRAYASISNGGSNVKPYAIDRIEDEEGNLLYKAKPKYEGRVASQKNIKYMQKMMEEVMTDGTGSRIRGYEIPYNIIGKTGTTQNNADGYFIGCSPEVVVGVWVGTVDKRVQFATTRMGSGSNTALPIAASIFKNLSYWKRPILTNFEYDFDYLPCSLISNLKASDAYFESKSDTTYINRLMERDSVQLIVRDSLGFVIKDSLELAVEDSLKLIQPDSLKVLKNDSLIIAKDSLVIDSLLKKEVPLQ
jgi:penicillin-binding protein 1A